MPKLEITELQTQAQLLRWKLRDDLAEIIRYEVLQMIMRKRRCEIDGPVYEGYIRDVVGFATHREFQQLQDDVQELVANSVLESLPADCDPSAIIIETLGVQESASNKTDRNLHLDVANTLSKERSRFERSLHRSLDRWMEDVKMQNQPVLRRPDPPPYSECSVNCQKTDDYQDDKTPTSLDGDPPALPTPLKSSNSMCDLPELKLANPDPGEFDVPPTFLLGAVAKAAKSRSSSLMAIIDWWEHLEEPERHSTLARIVTSRRFELVCLLVIIGNAYITLYETNLNMAKLTNIRKAEFQMFETLFTVFYLCELSLKLLTHRLYFFCNHDYRWNVFDLFLVALGVIDLVMGRLSSSVQLNGNFVRFLRITRISKVFRIIRLLRFFTELRLMLNCVMGSFAALFWSFVLIAGFSLIFAIVFVQQLASYLMESHVTPDVEKSIKESFGSVQLAMVSLFQGISGGEDWGVYYKMIRPTGSFNSAVYMFYILFVWLSMTNIITSIFVDKAMKLAQPDIDDMLLKKHVEDVHSALELRVLFAQMDMDNSGRLSESEFTAAMQNHKLIDFLELKGLAIKDATMFFNMLLSQNDGAEVDVDSFIGGCLKMKGVALNIDLMVLRYEIGLISKNLRKLYTSYRQEMRSIKSALGDLKEAILEEI